jgi:spore maturation protein CgeB
MNLNIVILGLSITSSWGNGHATTYRALVKALTARGHAVTFLERDVPWYCENRDLQDPDYCTVGLYGSLTELGRRYADIVSDADLVILGSYVPDGIAIGDWVTARATGVTAFYDIDTPVTLAGLQSGAVDYISPGLIPRFDIYLSFSAGPALGLVEDLYGSPLARPLYCSAEALMRPISHVRPRWSLGYLGTYSEDRQPTLYQLLLEPAQRLKDQDFVVAGSKYPKTIIWPANIDFIPHLPPSDHPGFYGAQRFTLNITRSDMRQLGFSPSVRMFEAAASGTPLISDNWPGIETVFKPGAEILVASGVRDVVDILSQLPEERRLTLAANARARLLKEHAPAHRALQLEGYYREALAHRRSTKGHSKRAIELEEAR